MNPEGWIEACEADDIDKEDVFDLITMTVPLPFTGPAEMIIMPLMGTAPMREFIWRTD